MLLTFTATTSVVSSVGSGTLPSTCWVAGSLLFR